MCIRDSDNTKESETIMDVFNNEPLSYNDNYSDIETDSDTESIYESEIESEIEKNDDIIKTDNVTKKPDDDNSTINNCCNVHYY